MQLGEWEWLGGDAEPIRLEGKFLNLEGRGKVQEQNGGESALNRDGLW